MENNNRNDVVDQVICRFCEKLKTKTHSHIDKSGKTIWKDHKGERWYGARCPDCYKKYKENYDAKRRLKLGHRPHGSTDICACGKSYIVRIGVKKMCPVCSANKFKDAVSKKEE